MTHATIHPDLAGASVLVTGGATGIGAALVRGFAAQGAHVAFIDIAVEEGKALSHDVARSGHGSALFIQADLRDVDTIERACREAAEAHGQVSVLVNNAARDDRHDIAEVTRDYWDDNQAINLRPQFFAIQSVAEGMKARGKGAIVNFSSIAFMINGSGYPAYAAAKAGVIGLTKGLAGTLGPHGIRVNAIAPGWVMTARQRELWASETAVAEHLSRQCLKREMVEDDLVGPCLFLASDASAMITAQTLIVDGGVM
jgi:galactose dehydrogenase